MKALTLIIRQDDGRVFKHYIPPALLVPVRVGRSAINTDISVEEAQQMMSRHQFDIVVDKYGYAVVNRGRPLARAGSQNQLEKNDRLPVTDGLVLTVANTEFEFRLGKEVKPSYALTLQCGDNKRTYNLYDNQFIRIGSDKISNDLVIPSEYGVSANHLRISVGAGRGSPVRIREIQSLNGIFVQDQEDSGNLVRVEEAQIDEGRSFYFGKVRGTVVAGGASLVSRKKKLLLTAVAACCVLGLLKVIDRDGNRTKPDKVIAPSVISHPSGSGAKLEPPPPDTETLRSRWQRIKSKSLEEKIISIETFQAQAKDSAKMSAAVLVDLLKAHVRLEKIFYEIDGEWERVKRHIKDCPWQAESYEMERLELSLVKEQLAELQKKETACSEDHYLKTQRIDISSDFSERRRQAETRLLSLGNQVNAVKKAKEALTEWRKDPWHFKCGDYGEWRVASGPFSEELERQIKEIEMFCLGSQAAWRDLRAKLAHKAEVPSDTFDALEMPDIKDLDVLALPAQLTQTLSDDVGKSAFLELRDVLRQPVAAGPDGRIQWSIKAKGLLNKLEGHKFIAGKAREVIVVLQKIIKDNTDKILADSVPRVKQLSHAIDAKDALTIAEAVIPPDTMEIYQRNLSEERRRMLETLNRKGLHAILETCEKLHAGGEQIKNIDPATFQKKRGEARAILEQLRKNYKSNDVPPRAAKVWRWCSQK